MVRDGFLVQCDCEEKQYMESWPHSLSSASPPESGGMAEKGPKKIRGTRDSGSFSRDPQWSWAGHGTSLNPARGVEK